MPKTLSDSQKKHKQLDIFKHTDEGKSMRLSLKDSIALSLQSLRSYGSDRRTWVVGFSGGKDSTATVTFIDWAIKTGQVQRPENLIVIYCDTLMELPSLEDAAHKLLAQLERNGWRVVRTKPELRSTGKTERFLVTMLGKGYPPPSNRFRWCTQRMKADKIDASYKIVASEYGTDFLGIDGIRKGESVARDRIIVASCSSDDGECGQGWFHKNQRSDGYKLSPILHWRLCHVVDWLFMANLEHGYETMGVLETYGFTMEDDFEDLAGRTGCMGCPLVTAGSEKRPKPDKALLTVLKSDRWSHLAPYQGLSDIYWQLRWNDSMRHIKSNGNKGCLTLAARWWALEKILEVQNESIKLALEAGRSPYLILRHDEEAIIRQMLCNRTFPNARGYSEDEFAIDREFVLI